VLDLNSPKLTPTYFLGATNLLRGLAALSVLLWHYQHFFFANPSTFDISQQPFYPFFKTFYLNGYFAVQLFWAVSGFVLCHSYMSRAEASWRQFFWARFSRLYPLHLITLITVAALQLLNQQVLGSFRIYEYNDVKHFALNVFFVQGWGITDGFSFNAPTWSVSVEIVVYVMFFILLKTLKRTRLFGAIALLALWTYATKHIGNLFFAECLSYFLSGVAIWFATQTKNFFHSVSVGLATTTFAVFLVGRGDFSSPSAILISILFLTAILDNLKIPFDQKAIMRFGELTYSAFLWHVPIQLVIILVLESTSVPFEIYKSEVFMMVYLVAVYLIANLSFVFIENPIKLLLVRRFSARQN
jgi:peptidoglycan/LPS O-acetylase OafA/YrhL